MLIPFFRFSRQARYTECDLKTSMYQRRTHGATLFEVLVVVGIIALLISILIPTAMAVRQRAYIDRCAENLRRIGVAVAEYRLDYNRELPRVRYEPDAPLTFGTTGPEVNDVTAGLFLLRKTAELPASVFVCPFTDREQFQPDVEKFARGQTNFTDHRVNLGYSIANLYPPAEVVDVTYGPLTTERPDYPLVADLNPGLSVDAAPLTPETSADEARPYNSTNHGGYGQNILMADGHVVWSTTPLAGIAGDDIYTNRLGEAGGQPTDIADTVMTPVAPRIEPTAESRRSAIPG
jgi:prepilin-type processing-associated H-X9-DG protein